MFVDMTQELAPPLCIKICIVIAFVNVESVTEFITMFAGRCQLNVTRIYETDY